MPQDNKRPYGGWLNHKYLELNGRIRRGIEFPRRERVLFRTSLKRMNVLYRELVPFYNPLGHSFNGDIGIIQWLDFCLWTPKGMVVVLFDVKYPNHGVKPHEQKAFNDKKEWIMLEKKIPLRVVSRTMTSYEYQVILERFLRNAYTL